MVANSVIGGSKTSPIFHIDAYVDWQFETAPDIHAEIRQNPVTGWRFVPGLDSIYEQKAVAVRAIMARNEFFATSEWDWPTLPLKETARLTCAGNSALGRIAAAYAKTLASNDFYMDRLPKFRAFARGMMAHPTYGPRLCEEDPTLLLRFPPLPLIPASNWSYCWVGY